MTQTKFRILPHALFHVQAGLCFHCVGEMRNDFGSKWSCAFSATKEHLIPKVKGGGNLGNLVLACRRCNTCRGEAPLSEEALLKGMLIYRKALALLTKENTSTEQMREKRRTSRALEGMPLPEG